MKSVFKSNGKLLLTGEYFVLDGAKSLATPTRLGQILEINHNPEEKGKLYWESYDPKEGLWFSGVFKTSTIEIISSSDQAIAQRLQAILRTAKTLNTNFLTNKTSFFAKTTLEFPRNWGLGSSSTLINSVAEWARVDPYLLLGKTFGGSGYDIACASADSPVFYQLQAHKPAVQKAPFNPLFKDQLYFVYLNQKQNSREGIARYRAKGSTPVSLLAEITNLTEQIAICESLTEFEDLLLSHESLVSEYLDLPRAQELYFKDFPGVIKSLGAWGGDYVLATSREGEKHTKAFFEKLGFQQVFKYIDFIL